MARKKIKKQDEFQESVFAIVDFVKKNSTIILLVLAVLVAGGFMINSFVTKAETESALQWSRIAGFRSRGELEKCIADCEKPSEKAWYEKCLGDKLYEEYLEEDAFKGDKSKLMKARETYESALENCPDEPILRFSVEKALDTIKREMASTGLRTDYPAIEVEGDLAPSDYTEPEKSSPGE